MDAQDSFVSLLSKLLPDMGGPRAGISDFLAMLDQKRRNAVNNVRDFSRDPAFMLQMMGRQVGEDLTQQARSGLSASNAIMSKNPDERQAGMNQLLPTVLGLGPLQTVYHGSPHVFDKFDSRKIGTGEGAQAYGHGLYFSEAPTVAKNYQAKVSAMQGSGKPTIGGRPVDWDNPMETAAFELSRHNGDRAAAADFFERTFKKSDVPSILRSDQPLPKVDLPGNLYKVDLPDEHIAKMLDWDKPLSQQPQLMNKTGSHGPDFSFGDLLERLGVDPKTTTGADLVNNVMGAGRSKEKSAAISKTLNDYGIPGIKYLDAGSRGASEGTRNYVVFDDKLLKILGRE